MMIAARLLASVLCFIPIACVTDAELMIPIAAEETPTTALVDRDKVSAAVVHDLNRIYTNLTKAYDTQIKTFKTSHKKISLIEKLHERFIESKECVDDLIELIKYARDKELKDLSAKLRVCTIKLFNAAEAINNNIGDTTNKEARSIITDSIKKVSAMEKELGLLLALCERYRFTRNTNPTLISALETCTQYTYDLSKVIKKAAETVAPAQNVFKRIFK